MPLSKAIRSEEGNVGCPEGDARNDATIFPGSYAPAIGSAVIAMLCIEKMPSPSVATPKNSHVVRLVASSLSMRLSAAYAETAERSVGWFLMYDLLQFLPHCGPPGVLRR
jgi:hypothetical protein